MKKLILPLVCCLPFLSFSQTTLILQPDAATGKDARIFNLDALANYGNDVDLIASQQFYSGEPGTTRSLIEFDLSSIPEGIVINEARLSLYYNNDSPLPGQTGSNAAYLRRLIEPWEESTVMWNQQPFYTTDNEVLLPASAFPDQDYENIDVTNLVRDMISNACCGFMFMLQTEQGEGNMKFNSSDAIAEFERPMLIVTYGATANNDLISKEAHVEPNPFTNTLAIKDIDGAYKIVISTISGHQVYQEDAVSLENIITIDQLDQLAPGIYFLRAIGEGKSYFSKMIKS